MNEGKEVTAVFHKAIDLKLLEGTAMEVVFQNGIVKHYDIIAIHQVSADAVTLARAAEGISQKQLAALSGMDQSDISKIERGVANPCVATLERIAKALGRKLSISFDASLNKN